MDVTRSRTQPNVFARRLFAPLAGRYDRLAEILSMGQNRRWRTAMVDHITAAPLARLNQPLEVPEFPPLSPRPTFPIMFPPNPPVSVWTLTVTDRQP